MNVFSNEDYVLLAEDIIHDSFYANNSISGKIQAERRCAELIVRKVLCLSESKKILYLQIHFYIWVKRGRTAFERNN